MRRFRLKAHEEEGSHTSVTQIEDVTTPLFGKVSLSFYLITRLQSVKVEGVISLFL